MAPASASTTTATRCVAERSISLLIMAVHPGLGVQQEGSGHHNAIAGDEAVQDFHAVAETAASLHATRLEYAAAPLHEHHAAQAGGDNGCGGRRHGGSIG